MIPLLWFALPAEDDNGYCNVCSSPILFCRCP